MNSNAPVFPHHARAVLEKRQRQDRMLDIVVDRLALVGITGDNYGAAQLEAERDGMDVAENQPDPYDGGEPKDTNWR